MEEAELDRRVRRIMTAWMAHWGELSPEHQATFLEAAEFRELALIPEEFGRKAINSFQKKEKILRESKRLQNERKSLQKRLLSISSRSKQAARKEKERKRQGAPGSAKPKRRICGSCGVAISIDGKCGCS